MYSRKVTCKKTSKRYKNFFKILTPTFIPTSFLSFDVVVLITRRSLFSLSSSSLSVQALYQSQTKIPTPYPFRPVMTFVIKLPTFFTTHTVFLYKQHFGERTQFDFLRSRYNKTTVKIRPTQRHHYLIGIHTFSSQVI